MLRTLLLLALTVPALAELRTWTDSTGQHKTRAELIEAHGDFAYLRANGKTKPIPVGKLSDADQKFIQTTFAVQVLSGKVVGVADGDTFTLLDSNKQQHRIRLEGIDAPESKQDFGTKSKNALADRVFGKEVRVEWKEKDQYGRILGHVIVGKDWVNYKQVTDGWAWHYTRYSKSPVLADAETAARKAKLGLWAGKQPIPPWEFRNPPADKRPPPPTTTLGLAAITSAVAQSASTPANVTVYVTDNGGKYHRENCQYLRKSKHEISLSEALKAYEPCSRCHPPTE